MNTALLFTVRKVSKVTSLYQLVKQIHFVFCLEKNGEKWKKKRKNYLHSITIFHQIFNMVFFSFTYHSFFILDSSLHLEDNRKSFVSRGYKADDEESDDGELPCSKGVGVKSSFKYLCSL